MPAMGSLAAVPDGPSAHRSPGARLAANRHRQCELYGAPLGDRVRALTAALGITQARLARTLGMSPPMLSQLASGRRVKIGDPAVLARLMLLDRLVDRCAPNGRPLPAATVETVLGEVIRSRPRWTSATRPAALDPEPPAAPARRGSEDGAALAALRALSPPARLAAAAATLAPGFPELAELLRRAAGAHRP
jgi:transcriptional regulator with XRE-family HTH domain